MMQKLMEINDHLVRTLAECEQLRSDQKTLQEVSFIRSQRIAELQTELRKAYAERDEAVEHAGRLQAELDATRKQLQDVCSAQSVRSAGQSDLVRDVSHYTEAAEVDTPVESQPEPQPEYKPYTFAAYIVGDKIQPDALRIVWATEEWIIPLETGIPLRLKLTITDLHQNNLKINFLSLLTQWIHQYHQLRAQPHLDSLRLALKYPSYSLGQFPRYLSLS